MAVNGKLAIYAKVELSYPGIVPPGIVAKAGDDITDQVMVQTGGLYDHPFIEEHLARYDRIYTIFTSDADEAVKAEKAAADALDALRVAEEAAEKARVTAEKVHKAKK